MKIIFAIGLQMIVLLAFSWPIVWVIHQVRLAVRRSWSSFVLTGLLIGPYLAATGACIAQFVGGHSGPSDRAFHSVLWGSVITLLVLWILLLLSIRRSRSRIQ